jgi:hypothetical protein
VSSFSISIKPALPIVAGVVLLNQHANRVIIVAGEPIG